MVDTFESSTTQPLSLVVRAVDIKAVKGLFPLMSGGLGMRSILGLGGLGMRSILGCTAKSTLDYGMNNVL